MPCNVNDISVPIPEGLTGPSIPGFGNPFAINTPNINPFPEGFPEDLLSILDTLQLLIPPGALKPSLNLNFGKDIFDAIMKLLDQFLPFLMMYKFFLPILNIIVCIIEVICAIPNPFKLSSAIIKLFTECIPAFLLLFPIFALIIMIISLLLLMLALIEYIISQILKFIETMLRNISMLISSFQEANANSVLSIAKKLGALLCIFQNLFVLLAIFSIIIQIIKDILGLAFAIPPCDDSNPDGCCTSDVCPNIVKNPYTRTTGTLQYLNGVGVQTTVVLPAPLNNLNYSIRNESWQLFDIDQNIAQKFMNIVDGYDVPASADESPPFFKPIFFPTDVVYSSTTSPKQAAYTIDLKMLYNPSSWGRDGELRYIVFKDCIVTHAPSLRLSLFDNSIENVSNGVLLITGGRGYEEDGETVLTGFDVDGTTPITDQASLNNFIHKADVNTSDPVFLPTDGYAFSEIEYSFKPNLPTLLNKNLITTGCLPDVSLSKAFVNNALAGDVVLKTQLFRDLLNSDSFPNPANTQQCLSTALSALRSNLTVEGVSEFQATATLCLQELKDNTLGSLSSLIGLGFDPCKSSFTVTPTIQFTSKPIEIKVTLNENNGIPLTSGIPSEVGNSLARKITAHVNFGEVSNFTYDGYQFFTANITSPDTGSGQVMISFDNNILCTNVLSPPSHTLQSMDYQFVYTPVVSGDQIRRDETDVINNIKDQI